MDTVLLCDCRIWTTSISLPRWRHPHFKDLSPVLKCSSLSLICTDQLWSILNKTYSEGISPLNQTLKLITNKTKHNKSTSILESLGNIPNELYSYRKHPWLTSIYPVCVRDPAPHPLEPCSILSPDECEGGLTPFFRYFSGSILNMNKRLGRDIIHLWTRLYHFSSVSSLNSN